MRKSDKKVNVNVAKLLPKEEQKELAVNFNLDIPNKNGMQLPVILMDNEFYGNNFSSGDPIFGKSINGMIDITVKESTKLPDTYKREMFNKRVRTSLINLRYNMISNIAELYKDTDHELGKAIMDVASTCITTGCYGSNKSRYVAAYCAEIIESLGYDIEKQSGFSYCAQTLLDTVSNVFEAICDITDSYITEEYERFIYPIIISVSMGMNNDTREFSDIIEDIIPVLAGYRDDVLDLLVMLTQLKSDVYTYKPNIELLLN